MELDTGILSNKTQLPITKLNYGGSGSRFAWILYQIGNLKCHGKADGVLYPSEQTDDRLTKVENDVEENSQAILSLKWRTSLNEVYIETNSNDAVF